MRETYGRLLPEMRLGDLAGKLIVIEGTDGAGRSTQIDLLKPWLAELGHAGVDTGRRTRPLAGHRNAPGKAGHYRAGEAEFVLRDGFCGQAGKRDCAGVARRVYRADRSLHLFADGAGDRARHGPALDSEHL